MLGVQVDGPVANRRLTIKPRLGNLKRVEGVRRDRVRPCAPSVGIGHVQMDV